MRCVDNVITVPSGPFFMPYWWLKLAAARNRGLRAALAALKARHLRWKAYPATWCRADVSYAPIAASEAEVTCEACLRAFRQEQAWERGRAERAAARDAAHQRRKAKAEARKEGPHRFRSETERVRTERLVELAEHLGASLGYARGWMGEVAHSMGIPSDDLRSYLKRRKGVTQTRVARIAQRLGVDVDWFEREFEAPSFTDFCEAAERALLP